MLGPAWDRSARLRCHAPRHRLTRRLRSRLCEAVGSLTEARPRERPWHAHVGAMYVVDHALDLGRKCAGELEWLEVAFAVPQAQRDYHETALLSVYFGVPAKTSEPLVNVSLSLGGKPSAHRDTMNRQSHGRPCRGRATKGRPEHAAQLCDASLILQVNLDVDGGDRRRSWLGSDPGAVVVQARRAARRARRRKHERKPRSQRARCARFVESNDGRTKIGYTCRDLPKNARAMPRLMRISANASRGYSKVTRRKRLVSPQLRCDPPSPADAIPRGRTTQGQR